MTHPLERLKRIADETIRKQAIENFSQDYYAENCKKDNGTISFAIMWSFVWRSSPQEYDYWKNIYYLAINNQLELLPEPIEDEQPINIHREIADQYQGLFNLMSKEYGLTLTISEMDEIVSESLKLTELEKVKLENEKLRECLDVVYKSLCTYGMHPIIDNQVNQLYKQIGKPNNY
jgi:hypothetical protein